MKIIAQMPSNLIKKLVILMLVFLMSCNASSNKDPMKYVDLVTPDGTIIKTSIMITLPEHQKGLSGTRAYDFDDDQAVLFIYAEDNIREYWMPDTYFDLDIIFLDKDLKIVDIHRDLPHYIGRENEERIPRSKQVYAHHVLEMKASSKISKALKVGDRFQWKSSLSLSQIESKTRLLQ